jgi:hypothetical protein
MAELAVIGYPVHTTTQLAFDASVELQPYLILGRASGAGPTAFDTIAALAGPTSGGPIA